MQKPVLNTRFPPYNTLNQFLYATEKLEKRLELPYVPKTLRISDQAMKTLFISLARTLQESGY